MRAREKDIEFGEWRNNGVRTTERELKGEGEGKREERNLNERGMKRET